MPKFHLEKLTDYNVDDNKINLVSYDNSITIYDNFTRIDLEKDGQIIRKVSLKDGTFTKLWFGIDTEADPDDENFFPFKTATINYDADSLKVKSQLKDGGAIKVCSKSEEVPVLPDFVLNEDGEFLIIDKYNNCNSYHDYVIFDIKDSGEYLVDNQNNQVSFRHAIDIYKDDEKVGTYQNKVLSDQDGEEFYIGYQLFMPSKNEGIAIIDTKYPNFAKASLFSNNFNLSDLEMKLYLNNENVPVIDLYFKGKVVNEFGNTIYSDKNVTLDMLNPVLDELQEFVSLLTL